MNISKENIENLTGLWKLVGEKVNGFYSGNGLGYCKADFSEWPNRLWFLNETNMSGLKIARNIIEKSETELKLTTWHKVNESDDIVEKQGFKPVSEQVGMSLKLNQKYPVASKIHLTRVDNEITARLWSQLFRSSFGYEISSTLIFLTYNEVDYFIAYREDEVVGTCLLFHQGNNIVGIHSLGVIPEMRRRGFAEEIMKIVLNKSIDEGFQYATLQASAMAKQMYEKLGFSAQFIMTNYQLKN